MKKGRLIWNGKDGWTYERDGKAYDLLEGKSIGGISTSDICFVMELDDDGCYSEMKTWFCLGGVQNDPQRLLEICDEFIDDEPTAEEKLAEIKRREKEIQERVNRLERELSLAVEDLGNELSKIFK